jgi:hypothetical protein
MMPTEISLGLGRKRIFDAFTFSNFMEHASFMLEVSADGFIALG